MFKSVGEGMEYEASGFGSDEDMSSADNVSFQSPSDTSGLQENTESPPPVRKMFWHSLQIEKVQELVPEEIRWFYKEDSKARWVAFIGYDSLRIECRFRALEYARQRSNSVEEEDIDANIHVRGGLYEVDITNSKIHPVYWKGKSLPILRGTWFVDGTGQPLEYEYSLQLEQDHLTKFRGMSIPDSQTDGKKAGKTEV
ncbi:DDHD1 [Bugula neritina]|uniref:DDHD1 n=1 Tax=Bugula neritina TaxID=10212 RepID=A0A7J7J7R6_BUGNE|nr:DDHD1 [Bugula neritina]